MSFDLVLPQNEIDLLLNEGIDLAIVYGIPGISEKIGVEINGLDDYEEAMRLLGRENEL